GGDRGNIGQGGKVGQGGVGSGNLSGKYQGGGVTVGPKGGANGKSRPGITNPYPAYGERAGVVAGQRGTYYRSTTAIRDQGVYVRRGVAGYPCFRPGWYTRHPGAWFAAGWATGAVWRAATWDTCAGYCGIVAEPIYYDYGESVVYEDDG